MDPKQYEVLFAAEDWHWWYLGMQRITTRLLSRYYPGRTDLKILDAGCGTGAAMGYLSRFGKVSGGDVSPLGLGFCKRRCLTHLSQASVTALPFHAESFDLVTSFDVLYHRAVQDYGLAMFEFHRVLRRGGRLLLRLPAYNWLRGPHDEAVHTAHRFTATELRQALASHEFAVEKLSYANTVFFPFIAGKRLLERAFRFRSASDLRPHRSWQDRVLVQILYAEASWLQRRSLPWGLSVIAVGKKQ